jgi:hypothetical protein
MSIYWSHPHSPGNMYSVYDQKWPTTVSFEALSGSTSNGVTRVRWFAAFEFFFSSYFFSHLLEIHASLAIIKSFPPISFLFQLQFLFFWLLFICFEFVLFFLKNSSLSIWSYFIFISNLIFIFLLYFFIHHFPD